MQNNRSIATDFARSALMFYIVVILHALFWLEIFPTATISIFLFEMPFIFLISGYAYGLSKNSAPPSKQTFAMQYWQFIATRFSRILLPFFAYAIVCACICMLYAQTKSFTNLSSFNILMDWLNPITRGKNASFAYLSSHLWFVPTFLGITALLPFATKISLSPVVPAWILFIVLALIFYFLPVQHNLITIELQQIFFYLIWALAGFYLQTKQLKLNNYACLIIVGLGSIYFLTHYFNDTQLIEFNMQLNKFPPNLHFFVFSSMWVACLFLVLNTLQKTTFYSKISHIPAWLKPFKSYGYSIYLWQGLAYTVAISVGAKVNESKLLAWIIAVGLSIALGMLFSRLEHFKIKFNHQDNKTNITK